MLIHESPTKRLYSNQELEWFPSDTKELYESNLLNNAKREQLETYGWIDNHFTYKFNSEGFRCGEFTTTESIVFLGCSFTMGIGLPIANTFARVVADELGLECYNLGVGGSSNDTAFRLARHWVPHIRPKLVILMSPSHYRLEIKEKHRYKSLIPSSLRFPKPMEPWYEEWVINESNGILNQEKNQLAIAQICHLNGIKFLCFDVRDHFFKPLDLARDLFHVGV
jgi:hypothetical protein